MQIGWCPSGVWCKGYIPKYMLPGVLRLMITAQLSKFMKQFKIWKVNISQEPWNEKIKWGFKDYISAVTIFQGKWPLSVWENFMPSSKISFLKMW